MAMTQDISSNPVQKTLDEVVRHSYGRLLSYLAYRWQNLAAAEDALSDAMALALERWAIDGVPDSPQAWLMQVAKRQLLQKYRHDQVVNEAADEPALDRFGSTEVEEAVSVEATIPDRRLKLLFVCAHPAIDSSLHTALMLQTVLGLDAVDIAQAYALPASTLAQRLVRAKQKIKLAGIRFEEPELIDVPERLTAVLEAIYAAFSMENSAGEDLSSESIYLASVVAHLLPNQPEVLGLWSLLLSNYARKPAQYGADGEFIALHQQDTSLWLKPQIEKANDLLYQALALRQPGAYQLEAAIQSAHCQRLYTGRVPWSGIVSLYEQLKRMSPTLGGAIGLAAAQIESGDLQNATLTLAGIVADYPKKILNLNVSYWLIKARHAEATYAYQEQAAHLESALAVLADLPQRKSSAAHIQYIQRQRWLVLCKT